MPISLYIGLRYLRAKKRSTFISFITGVSIIGIALGVTILITVLSVMNGFDYEIRHKIFSLARQVTIQPYHQENANWKNLKEHVEKFPEVTAAAPLLSSEGMLVNGGAAAGVLIQGVVPELEQKISHLADNFIAGSFTALVPGRFNLVLGDRLAQQLGVNCGDQILLFIPKTLVTPLGVEPRFKRFTVVGIYHVGSSMSFYDSTLAIMHLDDAQRLLKDAGRMSLNLKLTDMYRAPSFAAMLNQELSSYWVSDWTQQFGAFFRAIQMEKTTMFIVLLFIIAVAVFNLVSSMVMSVKDKQAEIAILRTLGASPRLIMQIFIIQGSLVGLVGTILGVLGGIALAINAPSLVTFLEQIFHTSFISSGVYFVDYLPSRLMLIDVIKVSSIAFMMSFSATILPARRAARVRPAVALRYE